MTTKQEEESNDGSERLERFKEVGHRQKYAGGLQKLETQGVALP